MFLKIQNELQHGINKGFYCNLRLGNIGVYLLNIFDIKAVKKKRTKLLALEWCLRTLPYSS